MIEEALGMVLMLGAGAIGAFIMWVRKTEQNLPVLRVLQDSKLQHHHNFKNVGDDGFPVCVCGDRYTDAGLQQEGTRWNKDHWEVIG